MKSGPFWIWAVLALGRFSNGPFQHWAFLKVGLFYPNPFLLSHLQPQNQELSNPPTHTHLLYHLQPKNHQHLHHRLYTQGCFRYSHPPCPKHLLSITNTSLSTTSLLSTKPYSPTLGLQSLNRLLASSPTTIPYNTFSVIVPVPNSSSLLSTSRPDLVLV